MLNAAGHTTIGLARSARRAAPDTVVADALDRAALAKAVDQAAPDVVVNLLTAIPAEINPRRLAADFALTNRLRTEGTRNLVAAAPGARIISQGLAYAYQPGPGLADEDASLWTTDPPRQYVPVLAALRELEETTAGAAGLVLRFGHLYGPGSVFAADGSYVRQARAGRLPIVGDGGAVFSFTHADDAASAIVSALDRDVSGVLNIVDDTPTPVLEWLPGLARLLDAPAPRRVPAALARLAVGGFGVAFMTRLRGADNCRARLRLNWRPRYTSWQDGFAAELGGRVNA